MTTLFRTTIDEVGVEAADLLAGGVLILFAAGAPPELAEVSVTHSVTVAAGEAPATGSVLRIDGTGFRITAVGQSAWQKIGEIGHVVFSFNGADVAERPGEICVESAASDRLVTLLRPGADIEIAA